MLDPNSCVASSKYDKTFSCNQAFDGNPETDWATKQQSIGAWIKLNLITTYHVQVVKIKQRGTHDLLERIGGILLEFADGTRVDYTLEKGTDDWQDVTLPTRPKTNFVKIQIKSVYGIKKSLNYGFSEIQIYGCL